MSARPFDGENCPCPEKSCPRHGNCDACWDFHNKLGETVFCENIAPEGAVDSPADSEEDQLVYDDGPASLLMQESATASDSPDRGEVSDGEDDAIYTGSRHAGPARDTGQPGGEQAAGQVESPEAEENEDPDIEHSLSSFMQEAMKGHQHDTVVGRDRDSSDQPSSALEEDDIIREERLGPGAHRALDDTSGEDHVPEIDRDVFRDDEELLDRAEDYAGPQAREEAGSSTAAEGEGVTVGDRDRFASPPDSIFPVSAGTERAEATDSSEEHREEPAGTETVELEEETGSEPQEPFPSVSGPPEHTDSSEAEPQVEEELSPSLQVPAGLEPEEGHAAGDGEEPAGTALEEGDTVEEEAPVTEERQQILASDRADAVGTVEEEARTAEASLEQVAEPQDLGDEDDDLLLPGGEEPEEADEVEAAEQPTPRLAEEIPHPPSGKEIRLLDFASCAG